VKYGNTVLIKKLKDKYGVDATKLDEWVPIDIAVAIYHDDVAEEEKAVADWARKNKIVLTQNQFDALVIQHINRWSPGIRSAYLSGKSANEIVDLVMQDYKAKTGSANWNEHNRGWLNRVKDTVNLFIHGNYNKSY
jgi:hypothetical protein